MLLVGAVGKQRDRAAPSFFGERLESAIAFGGVVALQRRKSLGAEAANCRPCSELRQPARFNSGNDQLNQFVHQVLLWGALGGQGTNALVVRWYSR